MKTILLLLSFAMGTQLAMAKDHSLAGEAWFLDYGNLFIQIERFEGFFQSTEMPDEVE